MNIETLYKLIKEKTNLFGYIKGEELIKALQDNYKNLEMRIAIIKEPACTITNNEIFNNILIPLIKAKQCNYRVSLETIYIYTRNINILKIINTACTYINTKFSSKYNFTITTNYKELTFFTQEIA